jgi:hypothetical protein
MGLTLSYRLHCQPPTAEEQRERRRTRLRLIVLILVGATVAALLVEGVPPEMVFSPIFGVVFTATVISRYLLRGAVPAMQGA